MTLDDLYLRRLDSLARFYNSQITAHVGYQISVTVGLLALLAGLSSVTVELRHVVAGMIGGMLGIRIPSWFVVFIILLVDIVCLALYLTLPHPRPFVFRHLLGTTQYYQEMPYIVFEHMGLRSRHFDDLNFETLRERALLRERKDKDNGTRRGMKRGIEEAAQSLLEARLFVSKCQEIKRGNEDRLQGTLKCLAKKLEESPQIETKNTDLLGELLEKVFDVTAKEANVIIRGEVAAKVIASYKDRVFFRACKRYTKNTLLFLGHREPSSLDRGTCLEHVFDC